MPPRATSRPASARVSSDPTKSRTDPDAPAPGTRLEPRGHPTDRPVGRHSRVRKWRRENGIESLERQQVSPRAYEHVLCVPAVAQPSCFLSPWTELLLPATAQATLTAAPARVDEDIAQALGDPRDLVSEHPGQRN